MSIERKAGGGYLARWREADGRQAAKSFARKIDADQWVATVRVDMMRGTYVSPADGKITVAAWWSEWSSSERQMWAPGTRERYTSTWARHIEPHIGTVELGRIRHGNLQAVITRSGLGPGGMSMIRAVLSSMFRAAVVDQRVAVSPATSLKVPRPTPADARPLAGDEIDRLLAACDDGERPWVLLGLATGVRISEGLAVRTATVDFLRRSITVADQARTPTAGPVELAPTKGRTVRTVPMAPSLAAVLARHVEATIPAVDGRRDGLLFPGAGGGLQRRGQASDHFGEIARRAGLDGVTWHNLRDTAATSMLRAGLNPAYVAEVIGNTIPVLLARYAGVLPADVELARTALEQVSARTNASG